MPQQLLTYRVFVSSPGDLKPQRQVAKEAIENLSKQYERRGIKIVPWLWEEQAASEIGATAQQIITSQLGPYDIYIGMMGARFGSATQNYGSGTEEEFYEAVATNALTGRPKLGFFFREVSVKTTLLTHDIIEQLTQVNLFRDKVGKLGLYREFLEDHTLSGLVSSTVSKFVDDDNIHLGTTPIQFGLGFQATRPGPVISRSFLSETLNAVDENLTVAGERLTLADLWVEPDLKDISNVDAEKSPRLNIGTQELAAQFQESGAAILMTGGETSGKSSICRKIFQELFSNGKLPVLLSGERINSPDIERFRRRAKVSLTEQYDGLDELQDDLLTTKCVVLIDDYDLARLSRAHATEFLDGLKKSFFGVLITVTTGYEFLFLENFEGAAALSSFKKLEIGDLGQRRRYELIERWCEALKLSREGEQYRHSVENRRKIVNRVLGSNLVPRTPFMILILLQAIDAGRESDLTKTGYVRYYKFLIDGAILKSVSAKDAEGTYALLPELAWESYSSAPNSSAAKTLSAQAAERVIDRFATQKALPKAFLYSVLGGLHNIGIFDNGTAGHRFRHPYVYYFFLADYISSRMGTAQMQSLVRGLCREVSIKESANLLVFLAYHTDNVVITETLIEGLELAYTKALPFEFTTDRTASINRLVFDLPKVIVDENKTKEQRLARLDEEEREEQEDLDGSGSPEHEPVSTMKATFTAVEILGHILRNHYAKLDAEPKKVIIDVASLAVLRCLGSMFDILSESSNYLIAAVGVVSKKMEHAKSTEGKMRAAAEAVFFIAYAFSYYCCRQLARAVGDENLEVTYRQIVEERPDSIMRRYLNMLIKLEAFREFPIEEVSEMSGLLKTNKVAMSALRLAVAERLDMRPPAPNDLQRICDMVEMGLKQRIIAKSRR